MRIRSNAYLLFWAIAFGLLVTVMRPGLYGQFMFDDFPNIVDNSAVHLTTLEPNAILHSLSGPVAGPLGRPISVISFGVTHYFFGLDPFAFKAVNLIIHAINSMLVAWFVTLLLRSVRVHIIPETVMRGLPAWVALAWMVHPINILPIMLVVQRMTLLSGTFLLLGLICHMKGVGTEAQKGIRWSWLIVGWLICWPLAIASKETGLLFPLYAASTGLLSWTPSERGRFSKRWLALIAIFLLMAVMVLSFVGRAWLDQGYAMRTFTMVERLMTEARVLWFYLGQIIVPNHEAFGLFLDDFSISKGLLNPPTTTLALIGWTGAIAIIACFWRQQPILSFSLTWFLVGHLLESTVLPLELVHEYRNYMPSIGPIVGIGYFGLTWLQKAKLDHRTTTITLVAVISVLVLGLLTWLRAQQLGNPRTGSQIEAERHPQSARANHQAAITLIKSGYGDANDPIGGMQIEFYLKRATSADPSFKSGSLDLILWACSSNRRVEQSWIEQAENRLAHTPYGPDDWNIPHSMLTQLMNVPKCLGEQDVLRLFDAGADNPRIDRRLRRGFLEAASDYSLLVMHSPEIAKRYLVKASAAAPEDLALSNKLKSFNSVKFDGMAKP